MTKRKVLTEAKNYLLYLLAKQEYSYYKLYTKLIKRKVSPSEAKEAIAWAEEMGYFSKERYLRLKINSLIKRNKSPLYIRYYLQKERITTEEIDQMLTEINIDSLQQIETIIQKSTGKSTQKIYYYLQRNGFNKGDILSVFQKKGMSLK